MSLKWIGAILIAASCAGYGMALAGGYRKEVKALRELLATLHWMISELEYRLTPLPELCRMASDRGGVAANIFRKMATELDRLVLPDAGLCLLTVVESEKNLPQRVVQVFRELARSMGRFSLSGQISELRSAAEICKRELSGLEAGQDARVRTYRTLGICAGVALVILLF